MNSEVPEADAVKVLLLLMGSILGCTFIMGLFVTFINKYYKDSNQGISSNNFDEESDILMGTKQKCISNDQSIESSSIRNNSENTKNNNAVKYNEGLNISSPSAVFFDNHQHECRNNNTYQINYTSSPCSEYDIAKDMCDYKILSSNDDISYISNDFNPLYTSTPLPNTSPTILSNSTSEFNNYQQNQDVYKLNNINEIDDTDESLKSFSIRSNILQMEAFSNDKNYASIITNKDIIISDIFDPTSTQLPNPSQYLVPNQIIPCCKRTDDKIDEYKHLCQSFGHVMAHIYCNLVKFDELQLFDVEFEKLVEQIYNYCDLNSISMEEICMHFVSTNLTKFAKIHLVDKTEKLIFGKPDINKVHHLCNYSLKFFDKRSKMLTGNKLSKQFKLASSNHLNDEKNVARIHQTDLNWKGRSRRIVKIIRDI